MHWLSEILLALLSERLQRIIDIPILVRSKPVVAERMHGLTKPNKKETEQTALAKEGG